MLIQIATGYTNAQNDSRIYYCKVTAEYTNAK